MISGARVERKTYDTLAAGETLRPLRDRILGKVLPLKLSDTIIADWKGSAVRCEVVACGPGRYPTKYRTGRKDGRDFRIKSLSNRFRPTEVRIGQIVHLGAMERGGGIWPTVYIGNEEHVLFQEDDICGIEA